MEGIYINAGLTKILLRIVAPTTAWGLFTNDVTPTKATLFSDLVEAAWTGYAQVTCLDSEWFDEGASADVGLIVHPPISFLNASGGGAGAYGYFVLDDNGDFIRVGRFEGAPIIKADGDSFVIIPVLGDFSQSA